MKKATATPTRTGQASRTFGSADCLRPVPFLATVAALCLLVVWSLRAAEEDERIPPFRRLLLPPERLEEELKRVKDGVLVRLPLAEFDALVQKATQARTRKEPPRLLEARYHATLRDQSLIGEGQWKLIHKGPGPGLLNLEPFNLALRQARFENGDALVAAFDGKVPALLVESPGERTVSLDWSARAEAGREGLHFQLEIPPCPVAVLELDVPVGRVVTVLTDGVLLSGPHEAEAADLRRWKIVCSGGRNSRIDMRILPADRPSADGKQTPVPFVRQKTTQKLHPDGLDAVFELTLDGLSHGIRELVCECDPELRLRDVLGPSVEGTSFQAGAGKTPSRLTIRLREPMRAGTWQILCLAPLTGATGETSTVAWHSPSVRLVNGVPRGETLTLQLHPELRIESWDPGSFRLTSSDLDRKTGGQVLTLFSGSLGPPRRPAARLQVHGVEFRAHQLAWWRCDASGMVLTVQIGWDVSRGRLFQLPVLLPAEWQVEKVEMNPAALLRDWRVRRSAGQATLLVDLAKPLKPQASADSDRPSGTSRTRLPLLTVQLRPAWAGPLTGKQLPLPDAVPLGARFREGVLALDCDEQLFHLEVSTTAQRSQPESEGPWSPQLPEYFYRYKAVLPASEPALKGHLRVQARPPRLRARCNTEVFVASGRAAVETHLLLEGEAGSPDKIDLVLSAGDGGPWQWRNEESARGEETAINRVRHVERLTHGDFSAAGQLLAARTPLQAAVLLAAQPSGERWRLTLARPLRPREKLRLQAQRPLQVRDNRWDVPLPVVLGAARMEGEVTLHLEGTELVHLQTLGLREAAAPPRKGAAPWRTFRYGQNEVGLSLSGQSPAADRSAAALIERARLITYVADNGVLRHHFSFQVGSWPESTLSLRLPPGSRPLAVQVDGRWLPRLVPAAASPDAGASPVESLELALPVPARRDAVPGEAGHSFEVVYTRTLPAGMLWQTLDAPAPQLPVAPLAFRRIWRLPARLTPLFEGRYQALPGAEAGAGLAVLPHHVADLFHLPGPWTRWDPLVEDRQAGAREALERAVQELRVHHADQKLPLREVISNLASLTLKDRYPLLIDALALREAGVKPDTVLTIHRLSAEGAAPPWAECGLLAVPARSAILLTTACGRGANLREPLSAGVEEILATAASRGQDPSGRFQTVLLWLQPDRTVTADAGPPPLDFAGENAGWNEWEPVAGRADERLIAVRRDLVTSTGLGLAALLGLMFWLLRRRSVRRRLLLLLLALALFGVGVLWLPAALRELAWWPMILGSAGAVLWYLRAIFRKTRSPLSTIRKRRKALSAAAVGGVLVLGILGWQGRAAAPAPVTVHVVPAPADAPDKQSVLVPVDLLDRLKTLARPAPLTGGGAQAVLLDASYEGQLVEGGREAEFAAVLSSHCLTAEAATLTLPLSGVRLVGEVFLDGARADLRTLPEPQTGYSVQVRGRGRHRIELRFRTPVVGTAEDRNVLFTVPPLVRNRLTWRVPAGASEPHIEEKFGGQWTTRDAAGQRLEADLGALPRPVHLHWYQPGSPTRVTYQAAYLWDLGLEVSGVESNRLTAWLRYRVERGAVKTLQVELPADLEVSAATAQRTAPATPPPWLTHIRLRDWYITQAGGKRMLRLELPYPVSGDLQVKLELLPRTPLSAPAALPLPSPRADGESGPHYLAFRTHAGLEAQRRQTLNLTRINPEEFAPGWPGVPRLEEKLAGAAYRITPNTPQQPPKLSLHLRHAPLAIQADVDLTVQAGAERAEIQAVARLEAASKGLAAVEWELPSPRCIIASVTGDEVRSWKQNGPRLLVWLAHTTDATRLRLSGWLPVERHGERSDLVLDALRLHASGKQHTRLHLLAAGDLALVIGQRQNLKPVRSEAPRPQPDSGRPGAEGEAGAGPSEFETWDSAYHLRCRIQPAANADARVLTLAEVTDRELRFTSIVDYTIRRGELRHVQLRLRNWEDEKVEIEAERVKLWPGPRRSSGERSWLLPLQAGVTGHYQVTLRGSMPLDRAAVGVPMPEVSVQGVENPQYYLAVAGSELSARPKGGLQPLNAAVQRLRRLWPGAAERLERTGGQAWRVRGPEWHVQLLPHPRALEPSPVRVYLLEQSAAVVDGRRWMYEVRCWLRHEAHAELNLAFALPARVLSATVDDVEVTPHAHSEGRTATRVWLPLPGGPGVRCLRLRWQYDPPEPLDQPNLTPPQVVDAVKGTTLWTVMLPPGWQAARSGPASRLGTGSPRQAALSLYRADAQLRISQDLARQRRDSIVLAALSAAQQRFTLYCRHAQQALNQGADRGDVRGPEGQSLTAWLEALQTGNDALKQESRLPKGDEAALDTGLGFPIADLQTGGGTPLSWQSPANGESLTLQLTSRESQRTRQTLAASGQWLGGLTVVWLLSLLPFLLGRLRLFWPEQIAALGFIGWHTAGLTSVVLLLFAVAVWGRVFLLVRSLRRLLRKRRHQPSTMTPGSGIMV